MGAARPIDKEINHYLEHLSARQKQVVLSVVKTFATEDEKWTDNAYVSEMSSRFEEMENGKIKTLKLEELEKGARAVYKTRKQGK